MKFVANREQVRSWVANWDFPEVTWPAVAALPATWAAIEPNEERWLEDPESSMAAAYDWVLDARPLTDSIARVTCLWRFRRGHIELLEIDITAIADPQYLAETLALGVHAAGLRGWSDNDARNVYAWLLNLLNKRPLDNWVRAKNRMGHVLVEALRLPHSRTEFKVQLTVTETDTALDGSPLDESGRPISQGGRGGAEADESGGTAAGNRAGDTPAVREPVRLLGDAYLGRGAVSRDNRVAVTVLDGRDLGVWATDSGRRHCILSGHDAEVRTVALSADGRVLVSGDEAGFVRVWDTRDARCVREQSIPVPHGSLTSVAVSADGAVQVMAANDGSVRVRADSAEHVLRVLSEASAAYNVGLEMGADVTATLAAGDQLVCVFDQWSWRLRVWDLNSGRFHGAVQFNRQFAFSAGGAFALAVTEDKKVRLVNLRSQVVNDVGSAAAWGESWLGVSDDGHQAFVVDGSDLQIWDLDTNRLRSTVDIGNPHSYFTVSGDGRLALVADDRRTARLVSLERGAPNTPPGDAPDSG